MHLQSNCERHLRTPRTLPVAWLCRYWLFLSDWITLTAKAASGSAGSLVTESVSDLTIQSTAAYSSVPNCLRQGTSSSGDSLAQYGAAAPSIHGTAGIAMLLSIAAVAAVPMLF